MEQIGNAFIDAFDWCANNPSELLWVLLPALFIFLWGVFVIGRIYRQRETDIVLMRQLDDYQKTAIAEGHDTKTRIKNYMAILASVPNNITLLVYKYCASHTDASQMAGHFCYSEYAKVSRLNPDATVRRRSVLVFNLPVLLLVLWGCAVAVSAATGGFSYTGGEYFTRNLVVAGTVLAFFIATTILLYLYRRSMRLYKTTVLEDLAANAGEFFAEIEPAYNEFTQATLDVVRPTPALTNRIKWQINREGTMFRQCIIDQWVGEQTAEDLEEWGYEVDEIDEIEDDDLVLLTRQTDSMATEHELTELTQQTDEIMPTILVTAQNGELCCVGCTCTGKCKCHKKPRVLCPNFDDETDAAEQEMIEKLRERINDLRCKLDRKQRQRDLEKLIDNMAKDTLCVRDRIARKAAIETLYPQEVQPLDVLYLQTVEPKKTKSKKKAEPMPQDEEAIAKKVADQIESEKAPAKKRPSRAKKKPEVDKYGQQICARVTVTEIVEPKE